jgi:hypothetical protein
MLDCNARACIRDQLVFQIKLKIKPTSYVRGLESTVSESGLSCGSFVFESKTATKVARGLIRVFVYVWIRHSKQTDVSRYSALSFRFMPNRSAIR